jgi:hypothetical protein
MHKGHTLKSYRSVSSLYWNAVFVRLPVLTPLTKSDLLHEFNSWKLTHQEWIISQRRNNCILFVFIRLKHFSTYLKFLLICPLEHESAKHKTQQQKPTTVTFYGSLHYVAMRCEVFNIRGFHNWRAYHYPLCTILFTTASRTALGPTQPPIQWVPGVLSLGVKRLGREADTHLHLVPRSKNELHYTSTPQYAFTAWCLVKA